MKPHTPAPLSVWQDFRSRHAAGDVVEGRVHSVVPFGAFVEVGDGIHGLLHHSEWSAEPEVGTDIRVRILVIDDESRRISLQPG